MIVENLPVPFDRRVWLQARSLHAAGAQVCVICPTGKNAQERYICLEGIHVYRHPLPEAGGGFLGYLREYGAALWHESILAWRVWRRHGFDVVHGCNPPDLIWLVALQFRLLGARFVFDHHDICPELFEAKYGRKGLLWRAMRLFERASFACASVSIATNESYARIARERGRMARERVFVVRSGPDPARLGPVAPNPRWRNGRRFMLGYVGVMGAQEGIELLLEAMQTLVQGGREDVQAVLVGGGPEQEALRHRCARMGLEPYVTFTGRVSDEVLFEVLSTADLCVNPDRVNPMNDLSTMNKILEYMAFGKPIVQFDVREGRVSAQEAALYARPNDPMDFAACIETLLDDPAQRQRRGALGRARLEGYLAWPYQVPALMAAYECALAPKGGAAKSASPSSTASQT